jgi:DNA-binding MarR family transcriptional regulator
VRIGSSEQGTPSSAGGTTTGREAVPPPAPSPSPTRLAAEAWEELFRAQVAIMRRLERDDIWGELSMREYDVLFQLSRAPGGALRLRELNQHILLSQPSLSRLVERLSVRGLIAREAVPDDGRGVRVRLTRRGADLQREIGRRHVRTIRRYVGGALESEQLRELADLCARLRTAQAGIPEEG